MPNEAPHDIRVDPVRSIWRCIPHGVQQQALPGKMAPFAPQIKVLEELCYNYVGTEKFLTGTASGSGSMTFGAPEEEPS